MAIKNVHHREVYRQMAFHGSCNPGRVCYAAHATMADARGISAKTVQRATKFLEAEGLIRTVSKWKGTGRTWQYLILGRAPDWTDRPAQTGPIVHQIEEGRIEKSKEKALSVSDTAQTIDPSTESEADHPSLFPFQEKTKTRALRMKKPVVSFSKVAALWFKLMRKLGRYCDDTMALAFDKKPHREKTVIIDGLQAVEQEQVYLGKMDAPPLKRPKGFLTAEAEEGQRLAACEHVPADDLPINCAKCGSYIGGGG